MKRQKLREKENTFLNYNHIEKWKKKKKSDIE